ncbi:MAG: EF-P 5-aminopentanol modification-associated protein YfmF [Oscillospiraceae bacterium]
MDVLQKELLPGVTLTALRTDKFKSSCLSLTLLAPMDAQTVTANALLPSVLRRGSQAHPDTRSLSAALDDLCGGTLEVSVRRQGETQCVGFVGSFLDDAFSPDGTPILESAAALMGELLLRPVTENGVFRADYVSGEGRNLADRIRAQINDKRQYAIKRLTEQMCEGEPYGLDKLGFADEAAAVTPQQLWEHYQALLRTAPIALYYCGSAPVERVEKALTDALSGLPERAVVQLPACTAVARPVEKVRYFEDALDVTQGKLALGWRTGGITIRSGEYPALLVLNAVYGGTTTSKLFMNVRERLSLCYFASSLLDKQKGLMLVSSGIEFDKVDQAREEILAQFRACVQGDFTGQELEAARRAVVSSLTACEDSQGLLESYWQTQAAAGQCRKPDELIQAVEQVTAEQVVQVATKMELDAVYFLKGKEG